MIVRFIPIAAWLAVVLTCPAPAAAQVRGGGIVEHGVVVCTNPDAALGHLEAMRRNDAATMARLLAEEICSRFDEIDYTPVRVMNAPGDGDGHRIVYAKMFHLVDIYVISPGPGVSDHTR